MQGALVFFYNSLSGILTLFIHYHWVLLSSLLLHCYYIITKPYYIIITHNYIQVVISNYYLWLCSILLYCFTSLLHIITFAIITCYYKFVITYHYIIIFTTLCHHDSNIILTLLHQKWQAEIPDTLLGLTSNAITDQSSTSLNIFDNLQLSSEIDFGRDCQMTSSSLNLDLNLNSAAWQTSCKGFICSKIPE